MDKLGVTNRLQSAGLRSVAEAYREAERQRLWSVKPEGIKTREQAVERSWESMWEIYKPLVEKAEMEREKVKAPKEAPQLRGMPENVDAVLDRGYVETDAGKKLRDGLLWCALEWGRVVRDTADGPVVDIGSATVPPPNAFAMFVLSTYAMSDNDKRMGLIARALSFAAKSHDASMVEASREEGGFLEEIS